MADGRTAVAAPDPLAGLSSLATTLGGTKTTTNAGNTDALQQALAGLRGQDGQALLQSIFQQASAQMPGLQSSMGRAIGARTRSNSPLAAALQQLLAQTTLTGQEQLAKQQAQNFQTQVQAGTGIAQATKGTTQQQGANLGQAGKTLAILAGLNKLFGEGKPIQDTVKGLFGGAQTTPMAPAPNQPLTAGAVPVLSSGGNFAAPSIFSADATPDALASPPGTDTAAFQPDYNFGLTASDPLTLDSPLTTPTAGGAFDFTQSFATPSIVESAPMFEMPQEYFEYDFADGGIVRAGGSRRSANPAVTVQDPQEALAQLASDELRRTQSVGTAAAMANASGADITNALVTSAPLAGSGTEGSLPGFNDSFNAGSGKMMNKLAQVNSLSGLTGGDSIPGMGMFAGLANAQTPEQAVGVVGKQGLNMLAPEVGALAGFAADPSVANGINIAASLNPLTATLNAGLGLFGDTSIGSFLSNAFGSSGNGGDTGGRASTAGADRGEGGGPSSSSRAGLVDGGPIDGPGTGTSDSIKANLSDGEFVMSADVVAALGEDFFNQLQAAFHTPKARARA